MKLLVFVHISLLQCVLSVADDEQRNAPFVDFLPVINEFRFIYNPIGGSQHILLEKFYRNYFAPQNESERKKLWSQKIAIYTHIYLLSHKMERNKEKLSNTLVDLGGDAPKRKSRAKAGGKSRPKTTTTTTNAFSVFKRRLLRLMFNNRLKLDFDVMELFATHLQEPKLLCELLMLKADLLTTLNAKQKATAHNEMPSNCESREAIEATITANDEHIKEWIFSDILHFWPMRTKLLQYFHEEIKGEKDKWKSVRMAFRDLIGFSRMAIVCNTHSEQLAFLVPSFEINNFYFNLYQEYFVERNWRNKIILDKFLYDQWARKFFSSELDASEVRQNDLNNFMATKIIFVGELKFLWQLYTQNFWSNEKIIRSKNENLFKEKTKGKIIKNDGEMLSAHRQQLVELAWQNNEMLAQFLLWENGPSDTFLLRALAICAKEAVAEFGKNFPHSATEIEKVDKFLHENQIKFLVCVGKNVRNSPRMDEFSSNLQFRKMEHLLSDGTEGEIFKAMLYDRKYLWTELLDPNGIRKLRGLLTEEINYSSAPEYFSSSSSAAEEYYKEAQTEFSGDEEENNAKNGQNTKEENGQMTNMENEQSVKSESDIWQEIKSTEKKLQKEKKNYQTKKKKVYKKSQKSEQNSGEVEEEKGDKVPKQPTKGTNEQSQKNWGNKGDKVSTGQRATNGKVKGHKIKSEGESDEKMAIVVAKEKNALETGEENGTKKVLQKIGIENIFDLLNGKYLVNLYKIYFEEGQFGEYLDMAMFVGAIEAMGQFIKSRTENWRDEMSGQFEEKWAQFKTGELPQRMDKLQFELNKLYFVQNELGKGLFGPRKFVLNTKVMVILGEIPMIKIGKNISAGDETFEKNDGAQKYSDEKQRTTQFGAYQMGAFRSSLSHLHLQTLCILEAEKSLNLLQGTECQKDEPKFKRVAKILPENWQEMLKKGVRLMELVQKQRNLVNNSSACLSYNLIRISAEERQSDVGLSNAIDQFIASYSIETYQRKKIMELLAETKSIVERWTVKFTKGGVRFLNTGSQLMDAELSFSDLDLLCVVSDEINLSHFHGQSDNTLFTMLVKRLSKGATVSWISGRVPLIRIEREEVEIDLLLVPVKSAFLTNRDLESDQIISKLIDESAIYSLGGYRSGKYQLSLIADHNTFASLLKAVKVWAKNRLIYSGIFGYFNGAALSVMATKISLLCPNAPLIYLLYQFFRTYSKFDWTHDQLLLDTVTQSSLNTLAWLWPPAVEGFPMAIITPKFPEQNASYNVNMFTFRTIVKELDIENPKNWPSIFDEIDYEQTFEHFALIACMAMDYGVFKANCGFQKSKIRKVLHSWATVEETQEKLAHYQLIPQSERETKCKMLRECAFCTIWLVGLILSSDNNNNNVNALAPIYHQQNASNCKELPAPYLLMSLYTNKKELKSSIDGMTDCEFIKG